MTEYDPVAFGKLTEAVKGVQRGHKEFKDHVCKHLDRLHRDTMRNRMILVVGGAVLFDSTNTNLISKLVGLF